MNLCTQVFCQLFVVRNVIAQTDIQLFTRSSIIPCGVGSADLKSLCSTILIGEPNKCIINVRNPKVINIHKRVIFKVIAFIPFQNASDKTPQPATSTIHVLSKAILFTLPELLMAAWGESRFCVLSH